jgi:hypothetical protein
LPWQLVKWIRPGLDWVLPPGSKRRLIAKVLANSHRNKT